MGRGSCTQLKKGRVIYEKLFALLLAFGLLGTTPALAAEGEAPAQEPAPLPAWSYGMVADGYALGLFGDEIYTGHSQIVTAGPAGPDDPGGGQQAGPAGGGAPGRRRRGPGRGHHPGRGGQRPVPGGGRLRLPRRGGGPRGLHDLGGRPGRRRREPGPGPALHPAGGGHHGQQPDPEPVRPGERRLPGSAVEGGQRGGEHPVPAGEHPHRREQHLPLPQAAAGHHPERRPGDL